MDPVLYGEPAASSGIMAISSGMSFLWLCILVIVIVSHWKVFTKAGEYGWASIIPFYNLYVLTKISGRSGWWFLLLFIPLVNIVMLFVIFYGVSQAFGKGIGYTIGLYFLPFIFWPMLAFGDAKYHGGADTVSQYPTS